MPRDGLGSVGLVVTRDTVGLVLSGGGARGAYEAGVVSVLLPELERRGDRPRVILGTSVGAINAAYLASCAHLEAETAVEGLLARWGELEPGLVVRPVVGVQATLTAARYAGEVLGVPGVNLEGLLDPSPLGRTLDRWIDWNAIHDNVEQGRLDAVGVVATATASATSVVFVDGRTRHELYDSQGVEYVGTRLGVQHVEASAAIPVLFPAIRVEEPEEARGWYYDGGTRLNTPLKPVLDFGVDRVAIVATHSVGPVEGSPWHDPDTAPDVADGLVQFLLATLADPLVQDVRMLGKINLIIGEGEASEAARSYRERLGKAPYRQVPYLLITPPARDAVGDMAAEVFHRSYNGLKGLRSPNVALLGRLLGGVTEPHAELLSYFFFEHRFVEELIEMGRRDAQARIDRGGGLWQYGPPGAEEGRED
jgi:NTE family protein